MKIVSSEQIRSLDRRTIEEYGTPGHALMERAGIGAADAILEFASSIDSAQLRRFVVLAGKGNNGGDAYVVAKYLHENSGLPVVLLAACPPAQLPEDARTHAETLQDMVEIFEPETPVFLPGDFIVDGLLGTGVKGAPRHPFDIWIASVNSSGCPVASLDVPSGLDADTGSVQGVAVQADITITMGLPKKGMVLGQGPLLCGRTKCVDIGIPQDYIEQIKADAEMIFAQDIRCLGRRPFNSHKGLNGRLLVVGGSKLYPGAPILSARAAMRAGAGLVTLAIPQSANIPRPSMDSIITRRIKDDGGGFFSEGSADELNELASVSDAVVIGPGMGTSDSVRDLLGALNIPGKLIIWDADGLNFLSDTPWLLDRLSGTVLTPHPGEMRRLLKGFGIKNIPESERPRQALSLAAKTNSVVVLKGQHTVTACPGHPPLLNSSGTPALASAGTGDVLSGIIGALLIQKTPPLQAAACAVFIHGLAAEFSPFGTRGFSADDLIDLIPRAMLRISPFA